MLALGTEHDGGIHRRRLVDQDVLQERSILCIVVNRHPNESLDAEPVASAHRTAQVWEIALGEMKHLVSLLEVQ
jgi:hypothetical protein